jgi:spore coat protein CotF
MYHITLMIYKISYVNLAHMLTQTVKPNKKASKDSQLEFYTVMAAPVLLLYQCENWELTGAGTR